MGDNLSLGFDLHIKEELSNDGIWWGVYDGDYYIDAFRLKEDAQSYLIHLVHCYSDSVNT